MKNRASATYQIVLTVFILLTCVVSALAQTPEERGEYLATLGNCASCHTVENQDPYSGGVPFNTPFGLLYATNITSHPEAGIGSWTAEQFERAMRAGIRADGSHLYPAFPYPSFTLMGDDDIDSLWAYVRTIPASARETPENDLGFPFSQRWLMGAWKSMYFDEQRSETDTAKSDEWNRGAYIVQGPAHCGACHTPRNFMGAEKSKEFLTGGSYIDSVAPGKLRSWSAANLTPSAAGLAAWTAEDIVDYLKTGHSARAGTFGPMNEVIVNSTSHYSDSDLRSVAIYLTQLESGGEDEDAPSATEIAAGEFTYDVHCGTCHLPTGLGDPIVGPAVVGSAIVLASDPASLINVILYGAKVPVSLVTEEGWDSMEGFEEKMTDKEIADVANFMRGTWGNKAPTVTIKQVTAQR